jgi:hypothetical protein
MRRMLPLSQPAVMERKAIREYNAGRPYGQRIKPFNFVQVLTPAVYVGGEVLPIAPFERDLSKAKRLDWMDLHSGDIISIDWENNGYAGTFPVIQLADYIAQYRIHPESKAADSDGAPSTQETLGLLRRQSIAAVTTNPIGKEADRLEEDLGTQLLPNEPKRFANTANDQETRYVAILGHYRQADAAKLLGISTRRLRDIVKGRSKPRKAFAKRIAALALASQSDPTARIPAMALRSKGERQ